MTRRPRHRAAQALLRSPRGLEVVVPQLTPLPDDVRDWLGQLSLLYGVPFVHLVADAAMLPKESIRFFHVDSDWIDAALDGALSVVDTGGTDSGLLHALRPSLRAVARRTARSERHARRTGARDATLEAGDESGARTGFLLRSSVVADVPGLTVAAYTAGDSPTPLRPLRIDRVAPAVMLAIFDGVIGRLELAQPLHGLAFGMHRKGDQRFVHGRGLGPPIEAGTQLGQVEVPLRVDVGERQVVDVRALHRGLVEELDKAYKARQGVAPPLNAGGFGLQMVAVGELQGFDVRLLPLPVAAPAEPEDMPADAARPRNPATVAELIEEVHGASL